MDWIICAELKAISFNSFSLSTGVCASEETGELGALTREELSKSLRHPRGGECSEKFSFTARYYFGTLLTTNRGGSDFDFHETLPITVITGFDTQMPNSTVPPQFKFRLALLGRTKH